METPDPGSVCKGIYRNNYFGIQVPVPFDWTEETQKAKERMAQTGQATATLRHYALGIVVGYKTEQDRKLLQDLVNNISFTKD